MRKYIVAGLLLSIVTVSASLRAQTNVDNATPPGSAADLTQVIQRVDQLEKAVQEPARASEASSLAQTNAADIARLQQRVDQLEKTIREMSDLLKPLKAQQVIEQRRRALHAKFAQRADQDRTKHTADQMNKAEQLYQVANQKWGTPEATRSLEKLIKKYPDINRSGCARLYLAQTSEGEKHSKYLQDCINQYGDCMYGDGVEVGAYARYLLAQDYRQQGRKDQAAIWETEIRTKYADAIDHNGNLLVDDLNGN